MSGSWRRHAPPVDRAETGGLRRAVLPGFGLSRDRCSVPGPRPRHRGRSGGPRRRGRCRAPAGPGRRTWRPTTTSLPPASSRRWPVAPDETELVAVAKWEAIGPVSSGHAPCCCSRRARTRAPPNWPPSGAPPGCPNSWRASRAATPAPVGPGPPSPPSGRRERPWRPQDPGNRRRRSRSRASKY